ncbi:hypothetical protein NX794_00095 [Streptomyces sp. LP11]|uniref:Integral membrane protein n=1 Tax=Streptomyces pyxinicus TaxID=2970331 RepID=A0ABT2ATS7_9ACTN|nr:hypothetical protein [Streptomyces sp. LP11]MCS0599649.1 hypothetical protein [Streptomyces sp. LP11]
MGAESVPRREVVTGGPLRADGTAVSRPAPPRPGRPDPAVRHLMRRQLRAALTVTGLLLALAGLLPVLSRALPPLAGWLLLGVAPYPVLLAAGAWYVRRAEHHETTATAPGERP